MNWRGQVIGSLIMMVSLAPIVSADIVKMKDGAQYQGSIESETDAEIAIEVSNTAGTVFHTVHLKKADIADVSRTTAEQKAMMEMEASYKQTLKYQLDPQFSQPAAYYDQIVNGVFTPYLNKYPGSPHEKEMADRIALWTAERDKVLTGQGRIGADWLPAVDFSKRLEETRVTATIDKGNKLASQSRFEEALNTFRDVPNITKRRDLVDIAKKDYIDVSKMWIDSVERQREPLNYQIHSSEEQLNRVKSERDQAEQRMHTASTASVGDPSNRRIGQDAEAAQYSLQYNSLRAQYEDTDRHIQSLKADLANLETTIARVKTAAAAGGALVGPSEAPLTVKTVVVTNPTPAAAVEPEAEKTPDVLVSVADYFKRFWMIGLVGFVVVAWACTRMFK